MTELLKVMVPAILALIGTLVTVLIGYKQWKRQQETTWQGKFQSDRQVAYQLLWELVTGVENNIRDSRVPDRARLDLRLMEVNRFILENSLHIDNADGTAAIQYLQDYYELGTLNQVASSGYVRQTWLSTNEIPSSIRKLELKLRLTRLLMPVLKSGLPYPEKSVLDYEKLLSLFRKVLKSRTRLVARVRRVMSGQS